MITQHAMRLDNHFAKNIKDKGVVAGHGNGVREGLELHRIMGKKAHEFIGNSLSIDEDNHDNSPESVGRVAGMHTVRSAIAHEYRRRGESNFGKSAGDELVTQPAPPRAVLRTDANGKTYLIRKSE
jgi:hypothetical protein